MTNLVLDPIDKIAGSIHLAGSKSITNRVLLLSALAKGEGTLHNVLESSDTRVMLDALQKLGISLTHNKLEKTVRIKGCNGSLPDGNFELYLENAGTAVRSLCAVLCLSKGTYTLTGNERMQQRPIGNLLDALKELNCSITCLKKENFLPLRIDAQGIKGGSCKINGTISSQYLTALLLTAPYVTESLTIEVIGELTSKSYIDMTIQLMKQFNVEVINNSYKEFKIIGNQQYIMPENFYIEGDASSGSYFLALGALKGECRVYGYDKNSIQGESKFSEVLAQMGALISYGDNYIEARYNGQLNAIDIDMNNMTDTGMTLAVVALFAKGTTTIRNIANWQVKETERINAVASQLTKLGAEIKTTVDSITITPPATIQSSLIETYDDHRMAMAFAIASISNSTITIQDPSCTKKTFPDYFDKLKSVTC